jgi:DNA-binding transcriptional regulator YiaG
MAAATSPIRYARIPVWLRELQFVTDFFSWLFALCSRLAEPFMLICTLYIVAEAGVPAIALPAMHNLAIGIMITSPELILPGAFVVASQAVAHARMLFAVCWTFVALTLITLMSLFVWHFTGASLAWLMCARCATAVGYSILMRVMHHERRDEQAANSDRTASDHSNTEAFNQVIEQVRALTASVSTVTLTVRELGTTSTPKPLPRQATTSEYVPITMRERGDHLLPFRSSQDGFSLVEHGSLVEENTHGATDLEDADQPMPITSIGDRTAADQSSSIGDQVKQVLRESPHLSNRDIASLVGCSASTVSTWRRRIEQIA